MRCYLEAFPESVVVSLRAESDDGETVGDSFVDVAPGDDFYGIDYAALRQAAAGAGYVDLPPAG
jgi:hypothetical protein